MTLRKFGRLRWPDTPAAQDAPEIAVEQVRSWMYPCGHCQEHFTATDAGFVSPLAGDPKQFVVPYHEECFLRTVVGSIAHQQHKCRCYVAGGAHDSDPVGMTKRQAARAAVFHFMRTRPELA